MPSLPRAIKRAGEGAVTMPGKTPQVQLGRYRLRRITRRQTRVSISTTWASSVPGNGSRGRPQRGHFCCASGRSATSSRASSPSRRLRPCPRLPGCCPRGRALTWPRDGFLPSPTLRALRRPYRRPSNSRIRARKLFIVALEIRFPLDRFPVLGLPVPRRPSANRGTPPYPPGSEPRLATPGVRTPDSLRLAPLDLGQLP